MNLLIESMRAMIQKINCCKMNERSVSHHNLYADVIDIQAEKLVDMDSVTECTPKIPQSSSKFRSITDRNIWLDDPISIQLWDSCLKNDLNSVQELLSKHSSTLELNAEHPEGLTLLHKAVILNNLELVKILLLSENSVNINSLDKDNRTALHLACIEKTVEIAKALINQGALINAVDFQGNTALHYAIQSENSEIIEFIVCMCPDLEIKNHEGLTAIDLLRQKNVDFCNNYNSEIIPISECNEDQNISINEEGSDPRPVALKDFEPVQLLGRGSFGEVFLVRMKTTSELFAMKVLKKERIFAQNLVRYVMTERNVLSYIHHPFIVRLEYAFQDIEKVFLILSYCPGGTLSGCISRFGKLTEPVAKIYMCEILLAIAELHRRGIIYRDLKPDNVVLDAEGHALLTDFGLSKEGIQDNVSATSFCGSVAYLAPEVMRRQGHGKAVDWYLFGVVLYEMLTGRPPYYHKDRAVLLMNIENAKLKIPPRLSEECKDLLRKLLKKDPNKRIGSVGDTEEVKAHEYFKGVDWEEVYKKRLEPPVPPQMIVRSDSLASYKSQKDANVSPETKLNGWTFVSD